VNATAGSLLGFLQERPMSGWDLFTTAQVLIGDFWTVTRSQVYRELAAMEAAGLVAAGPPGPRERRPYEITETGRAAFDDWLQRPPGSEQIRYPLLLTIAFGRHLPPGRLAEFVAEHRTLHQQRLAEYRSLRAEGGENFDAFAAATLDFGIRYEAAVLDWFDHLPPDIAGA
jgi:DNA-binding PadR family transcriptional regulator